jgi:lactoylglutathione lyase
MSMSEEYWVWGKDARKPRILHSMIRVSDLDRSLDFYCNKLGMKVLSRVDVEAARFSIVFVNFSNDYESGAIELTYNWDNPANKDGYSHGSGYGHVAIGVPDLHATCEGLKADGVTLTVEPKQMLPGAPALAFVKDPDGYAIELIQTAGYEAS